MFEKLSKYRIKDRLVHAFTIASGVPAAAAAVSLIILIIVSFVYSGALHDYGFAQGDVGKAMTYFSETRSALRGCIGYDDMDVIETMREMHDQNVESFTKSFADLERSMVTDENKKIYNDISSKLPAYWELENEILELGATTDREKCEAAQSRAINELMPLYDDINAQLTSIMDVKVERGDHTSRVLSIMCVVLILIVAAVIVLSMTFSIRLGRKIAKGISKLSFN